MLGHDHDGINDRGHLGANNYWAIHHDYTAYHTEANSVVDPVSHIYISAANSVSLHTEGLVWFLQGLGQGC